jgi:hypothetical protein
VNIIRLYDYVEDALNATVALIMRLEKGSPTRLQLFEELMKNFDRGADAHRQLEAIEATRRKVQAVLDEKASAVDAPTP